MIATVLSSVFRSVQHFDIGKSFIWYMYIFVKVTIVTIHTVAYRW